MTLSPRQAFLLKFDSALTGNVLQAPERDPDIQQAEGTMNISRPTVGEYAGEAAKNILQVVEAVAEQIPVPGVLVAVRTALALVKACEVSLGFTVSLYLLTYFLQDVHASLERVEELKICIKNLAIILVSELKGKKEVQAKLKEEIETLDR